MAFGGIFSHLQQTFPESPMLPMKSKTCLSCGLHQHLSEARMVS